MRVPERLYPLLDEGVIDEVIRPLMSGKEAAVYLVEAGGELRVAKVYKEAARRSFRQRAAYTEGRKVRNTRQQRAMAKRSRYGKAQEEAAWRNAEVDTLYRLQRAGVRVPEPYDFVEGVLVMELVRGPDGGPAPRLVDATFSRDEARALFDVLLREVVKMLCAGVVHGDLSDFNVLLGPDGPVIIDFPQSIDPAHNNNARKMLVRDVKNLTSFLAKYDGRLRRMKYGDEMWALYENNQLTPDTKLTGKFKRQHKAADTMSLLEEIEAAERDARARREALGLPPPRRARAPILRQGPAPKPIGEKAAEPKPGNKKRRRRKRKKKPAAAEANPLDALLSIED